MTKSKQKAKNQLTKKQEKDLKKLQATYETLRITLFNTTEEALSLEESALKFIQQLRSYIHLVKSKKINHLVGPAETLQQDMLDLVHACSQRYLDSLNEELHTTFDMKDIFTQYEGFYLQNGIKETVKTYDLVHQFSKKLLMNILPFHPKDEYPRTRHMKRKVFLHVGPTNGGKTYTSIQRLMEAKSGVFAAPLRLLAAEIFNELNEQGIPCDLMTGEEKVEVFGANHMACTIETVPYSKNFEVAVIDEGQLIGDEQRGHSWTRAILGIQAEEIHIPCAPHAVQIITQLFEDCGESVEVREYQRQTPLLVQRKPFKFPEDVQRGDALIVFSRKKVLEVAAFLTKNKSDISASMIYGNLPPETRKKQMELFNSGENEVVISTDAIGMGLNLPIKRVVFLEVEKFDGKQKRMLTSQEIKQIAGRAGRKGIYEKGFVATLSYANVKYIEQALNQPDETLSKAYISPLQNTIVNLPFGGIKERYSAWNQYKLSVPYFEKMDISERLNLATELTKLDVNVPMEEAYRASTLPFNSNNKRLLGYWTAALKHVIQYNEVLVPKITLTDNLFDLETSYQLIDLFYLISESFQCQIDESWIEEQRTHLSELIHTTLIQNIEEHTLSCNQCHKPLPWNRQHACKECIDKQRASKQKKLAKKEALQKAKTKTLQVG